MKVKFFVNLFPGYDPKFLSANTQNNGDYSNISGWKRYSFEVDLPAPDELIPTEVAEASPPEEVPRGEG